MDIDLKTVLLVLIIIFGALFFTLLLCFDTLDFGKEPEISQQDIQENSNVKNVIKNSFNNQIETSKSDNLNTLEKQEENLQEKQEEEIEEVSITNVKKPLELKKIEKNNTTPKIFFDGEQYVSRKYRYGAGYALKYKVPQSWNNGSIIDKDSNNGAYIKVNGYFLSEFGEYDEEETSYEEFLNDFMEKEIKYSTFKNDTEFKIRELILSEYEVYPILQKIEHYSITEYMVFVYKGYVYTIEITFSNEDYNDEFIKVIDNIFSSAHVSF
ncbi:MAG: hypothetical protein IKL55_06205 [Clostridia bacterium]|nr:hypothetical protein [Clostridia bacterium]